MNQLISILIGIGLVVLGLIISYLLSKRKSYNTAKPDFLEGEVEKSEGVKHYEEVRDEVVKKSYKKKKEPEPVDDDGWSFDIIRFIPKIVGFILVIIVGSNVLGAVCSTIAADNVSYADMPGGGPTGLMICTEDGRPGFILWFPVVIGAVAMLLGAFTNFWRNDGI